MKVSSGNARVPLAPRAIAILQELQTKTGYGILFPFSAARCMSENTINSALRRLGFDKDEMTGHGLRSAASSILNEMGLWNADAIERQLAHADNDSVRRTYARADFWEERAVGGSLRRVAARRRRGCPPGVNIGHNSRLRKSARAF